MVSPSQRESTHGNWGRGTWKRPRTGGTLGLHGVTHGDLDRPLAGSRQEIRRAHGPFHGNGPGARNGATGACGVPPTPSPATFRGSAASAAATGCWHGLPIAPTWWRATSAACWPAPYWCPWTLTA